MATPQEYAHQADVRETNTANVQKAMELLYETYIVDPDLASKRGAAVRAIDGFLNGLGVQGYAAEMDGRT